MNYKKKLVNKEELFIYQHKLNEKKVVKKNKKDNAFNKLSELRFR